MLGIGTMDDIFVLKQEEERIPQGIHWSWKNICDWVVPHTEIWRCIRVPEKYVHIIQVWRSENKCKNLWTADNTSLRCVTSASIFILDLVMHIMTERCRGSAPWCIPFADTKQIAKLDKRRLKISQNKTKYLCLGRTEFKLCRWLESI